MTKDVRAELKRLMTATANDRAHWHYHAIRPITPPATWKSGQAVTADCSKGVQDLCRWAGAPNPMGGAWDGYGNSQTIWSHLQHLSNASQLEIGDLVTFGRNGEEHVVMVFE